MSVNARSVPRIALGALLFEGNTFSPNITERVDFASKYLCSGEQIVVELDGTNTEIGGALNVAAEAGVEVLPLLATHGGAGGRVSAGCYRALLDELLTRLREAGPVDGLYLALHGAFIAEGVDDVETEVLSAARAIVGRVPLAVSCDLHAHITPAMLRLADIVIGYQHYPHDDTFETGQRAVRLLLDSIGGRIKPTLVGVRAPLIVPAQRQNTNGAGPMVKIRELARGLETAPVLALSYFPVQPWLDFDEIGFTAVALADGDAAAAGRAATRVAEQAWRRRDEFTVSTVTPENAIRAGLAGVPAGAGKPVVLADASDCVGGGASGDSAAVLAALLEHGGDATSTIHIVDPQTVAAAEAAGVGRTFRARLGNKLDPGYGAPLTTAARVLRVLDGRFRYRGGLLGGVAASLGRCAVVQIRGAEVLVSSLSSYEYADEHFQACGIDPWAKQFVVVKNPMNYQAAYRGAAAMFILATPGPTTPDLAGLAWHRLRRPVYPLDDDFAPRFTRLD